MRRAVSDELMVTIQELMSLDGKEEFYLGGGTNLAIKYNHRISTDIDLFSNKILPLATISNFADHLEKHFKDRVVFLNRENFDIPGFEKMEAAITTGNTTIHVDILQNVPQGHQFETKEGIRMIHDRDIGPLKLLSAADRGSQKDYYDLYLLSGLYGLDNIYDALIDRQNLYGGAEHENIFMRPSYKPKADLKKDLTPLGNFSRAGDRSRFMNRVDLIKGSAVDLPWPVLRAKWLEQVKELARAKGLLFKETQNKRKGMGRFR